MLIYYGLTDDTPARFGVAAIMSRQLLSVGDILELTNGHGNKVLCRIVNYHVLPEGKKYLVLEPCSPLHRSRVAIPVTSVKMDDAALN